MTSPDARRLLKNLFDDDYSSIVIPKQHHSDFLNVTVSFIPRGITEFNEVVGRISIALGVDIRWNVYSSEVWKSDSSINTGRVNMETKTLNR